MIRVALHPVLRHAHILFIFVIAAVAKAISANINPHSAAWLLALFTTIGVLVVALKRIRLFPILRWYSFYLANLSLYLFVVWFLHVLTRGENPAHTVAIIE